MIINELMEAKGITKYRLAKDSGIPYTTINDLRNMVTGKPPVPTLNP